MKFSIRDLLLVTVIVALAMGWAVDRTKLAREIIILQIKKEPSLSMSGNVVVITDRSPERKKDWLERLELMFRAPAPDPLTD